MMHNFRAFYLPPTKHVCNWAAQTHDVSEDGDNLADFVVVQSAIQLFEETLSFYLRLSGDLYKENTSTSYRQLELRTVVISIR